MSSQKEAEGIAGILAENNRILKENNQLLKELKELLRKIAINTA